LTFWINVEIFFMPGAKKQGHRLPALLPVTCGTSAQTTQNPAQSPAIKCRRGAYLPLPVAARRAPGGFSDRFSHFPPMLTRRLLMASPLVFRWS
jgi:hypothetical protein